jgi:hypothetical protein
LIVTPLHNSSQQLSWIAATAACKSQIASHWFIFDSASVVGVSTQPVTLPNVPLPLNWGLDANKHLSFIT